MTDAVGATFTDSVQIRVTDVFFINLTASMTSGVPGATFNLFADRTGGSADYVYDWSASASSGAPAGGFTTGASGVGVAQQTAADDVVNGWAAPAPGSGLAETYRITCRATDADGAVFVDTVHLVVEPPDALAVELIPDTIFLRPGETVTLTASQSGGIADFDYAWTGLDPAGNPSGTFANGAGGPGVAAQNGLGGSAANAWTVPANAGLGTYQLKVALTDALGDTVTDAVYVVVRSPLALNLSADDPFVTPGTAVDLLADQTGGQPDYDYEWTASNSSGAAAGTFTGGYTGDGRATQNALAGDAHNSWSVASPGTYTVQCRVTDAAGQVFADSITVVVAADGGLTLDVTADRLVVFPGDTVNLIGDQIGGTGPFDYTWTALDEMNAAAGTFGAASQVDVAGDTVNTWDAPTAAGAEGTYRIRCTAVDAYGGRFSDTVFVVVDSLAVQNVFLAPAAANATSVNGGIALNAFSGLGDPGQSVNGVFNHPDHPRSLVVVMADANNSVAGGVARVTGRDARGVVQTEVFNIPATGGGASTTAGILPFATVTQIDLFDVVGRDGDEQVTIGVGDKFGLTGVIATAGDVLYVHEGGTTLTAGYTVDATAGQQGVTFANAPNGVRNYIVVFRAD